MNPYWKDILRSIRGSFSRFMAILCIIALGVGFYSGLSLTMPSFVKTGDKFVTDYDLFDYRLISTIGFTDEDIEELSSLESAYTVRGAVWKDALVSNDLSDGVDVVRFHTITEGVNGLSVIEGRLPQADNEAVVDEYRCSGDMIGTYLHIADNNSSSTLDDMLYDDYLVVGTVRSPYYLNFQRGTTDVGGGTLSYYAYIPIGGVDHEYMTEVFVRTDTEIRAFSDDYNDMLDLNEDRIESECEQVIGARFGDAIEEAEEEYADGLSEFETSRADALAELSDAWEELSDARDDIAEARTELDDSLDQINDARSQIENGQSEIRRAREELDSREAELTDARREIESGLAQAESTRSQLQDQLASADAAIEELNGQLLGIEQTRQAIGGTTDELDASEQMILAGLAEAEAGRGQLTAGIAQTDAAIEELNGHMAEVESGFAAIADARDEIDRRQNDLYLAMSELDDGIEEYEDGLSEFDEGVLDYEQGRRDYFHGLYEFNNEMGRASRELYAARKMIDDARDNEPEIYCLTRNMNVGYVSFDSDSQIVAGIANVFPVFFFALAALVCSTTMQRMVTDDRTHIGTMKALGYTDNAIVMKYVIYSGSASVIGCVGGYLGGTKLFPYVIWSVYGMMYGFAPIEFESSIPIFILSLAVSLICSVGVTMVTTWNELKQMPAELIRPKTPPAGKRILLERITFLWKRLKFTHKVSIRNVFRFKKRMWMMIVGIAGCTALLITGFGINDSIKDIVDIQYDNILTYNAQIDFKDDIPHSRMVSDIEAIGRDTGIESELVFVRTESLKHNGIDNIRDVTLIISDDPNIGDAVCTMTDGERVPWPAPGTVAISSKLAASNDIEQGDLITFSIGDSGETFTAPVGYVFENYIFHYAFMDAGTYEELTGRSSEADTVFVIRRSGGEEMSDYDYARQLADNEDVKSWSVVEESRTSFRETMTQLNKVVILVICCAAALAFIVLFNLNNINITERVREIATIKVLGFYRGETGSYFFRESFILVFLGFPAGVPLGIALHTFVISQIEMDTVTFVTKILPQSYLYSLALVILFSVIVDLVMRVKIERIDMAESLKSVE